MSNNGRHIVQPGTGYTFPEYAKLRQLAGDAAAISFDFFDTLFIRPLAHAEDAFDILGRQFTIANFREHRRAAQARAFQRIQAKGRKEITLDGIYACFEQLDVSADELRCAEYALELRLIEPNQELLSLLRSLLNAGKPVVITSDMYLPIDFFIEALRPLELHHLPLFISADCNATKRDSGELFDVVASKLGLPHADILHVGDNLLADVQRAHEKGLQTFHYRRSRELSGVKARSLSMSLAQGMLLAYARDIPPCSSSELGYLYGGPAHIGFLQWIAERAKVDRIDHVLFVSRDGYSLERIARTQYSADFPKHSYFLGSRIAYTLAAIDNHNFPNFIPFLLSGSEDLAPDEILERIGVPVPAPEIMDDFDLGGNQRISASLYPRLSSFLYAYRWEILKICQRNRRSLFRYLRQIGIKAGSRVALVDVGWRGGTQEAFELAVHPMTDLQVYGYYFSLANTPERRARESKQRMQALFNLSTALPGQIEHLYKNRLAVELFFSAPHDTVIGLQQGRQGIEPVLDAGRGNTGNLSLAAEEISKGIDTFVEHYQNLQQKLHLTSAPVEIAWPIIELVTDETGRLAALLGKLKDFDTWASSRNS